MPFVDGFDFFAQSLDALLDLSALPFSLDRLGISRAFRPIACNGACSSVLKGWQDFRPYILKF